MTGMALVIGYAVLLAVAVVVLVMYGAILGRALARRSFYRGVASDQRERRRVGL